MSEAIRFLHALAQALATMALYTPGHPAARRGTDGAWEALMALLAVDPRPSFLFLGSAPVYAGRALHELSDWPWSKRLAAVLVQRLEFDVEVTSESFAELVTNLQALASVGGQAVGETRLPGVAYGPVGVEQLALDAEEQAPVSMEDGEAEVLLQLGDELDAVRFIFEEAAHARIARAEADAVARLLGGYVDQYGLPQSDVAEGGDPASHALNTALLVMAAGARAGFDEADRHRLGVAALWHDVGMTRIPAELAMKESLTPDERLTVEGHTVLGAQLLLRAGGAGLEFAALVAFEHHLRPDGTGYPSRRFGLAPHWASGLVGAAATYTALRAPRTYRAAWSAPRVLAHLESGAGTLFDADAIHLLVGVVAP
jgi:hypothetical protein